MRLVRLLAASAALACAGVSGQAWAVTYVGGVTRDGSGSAIAALPFDDFCRRCRITINAPGATSALPEFLYTFHVTPYRPSTFPPYDKTVAIPVRDDINHPGSLFSFVPNARGGGRFMPPRQIPDLAPPGSGPSPRVQAGVVGFNSASIRFLGDPNSQIDYSVTISAAPEPATWALMILGFGGIGIAMRRSVPTRSRRVYAPASLRGRRSRSR